jgi:hypothetical protein
MIVTGSRYMGQPVVVVPDESEGVLQYSSAVFGPPEQFPATFVYYTVLAGDRYDTIANELYGIPDYWWRIADANPEVVYPDQLIPGSIIRIPSS